MKTESLEQRLARIESRIVQLMLHLGVNPYEKTYHDVREQPVKPHQPIAKPSNTY